MVPKVQAGFKAEVALLARVDAFGAEMMREHPGLSVSRTDAIVMLLTEALNARGVVAPTEKRAAATRKEGTKRKASSLAARSRTKPARASTSPPRDREPKPRGARSSRSTGD